MVEMDKANAIEVHGLSKCYTRVGASESGTHELWALRDVSFSVKRGDSVGIFGHNGSGKSTLLKVLAGVTKPTHGTIAIRGRVASILDIGSGFHPELSGRDNIYLNSNVLGFSKRETSKLEQEIIEFSGISEFIDEPVKNYSSGMFLRLAFSILAHLDFDVYLFDEVFSVGDAQFEAKVNKTLRELIESDRTVILVSHQMSALVKQNTYLHLRSGVVQSFGKNQETLVDYLTESVVGTDDHIKVATANTEVKEFDTAKAAPEVRLSEIKLHQPDGNGDFFRTDREFVLDVFYEKLDTNCTLDVFVSITDLQDNVVLFTSPLVSAPPNEWSDAGAYQVQCTFPSSFFNARVMVLNISFIKNAKDRLNAGAESDASDLNSLETCLTVHRALFFKPTYRSDQVSLDLSKFEINSGLVPAFKWKQMKH